jgi:hypothetical protein
MKRGLAIVLALILTGAPAGAEWLLCTGSISPASSHACCREMQMVVTPEQATSCCTMSEQTRDRAPVGPRLAPVMSLVAPSELLVLDLPTLRDSRPRVRSAVSHAPSVPLYLQQRSLLI